MEFIEFSFAHARVPTRIEVYEQFPGALVRILGKAGEAKEYTELWSGPSDDSLESTEDMRTFAPPIKQLHEAMIDFRFEYRALGRRCASPSLNGVRLLGVVAPRTADAAESGWI